MVHELSLMVCIEDHPSAFRLGLQGHVGKSREWSLMATSTRTTNAHVLLWQQSTESAFGKADQT